MNDILQNFSAPTVAAAIEANLFGFTFFGRLPQGEIHEDQEILWYASGLPAVFNGVFRAQLSAGDLDRKIEDTRRRFTARQIPMSWMIGPSTRPADLGKRLEAHGFIHATDWSGMAIDVLALNENLPAPTNMTIAPVGDEGAVRQWAYVLTVGKIPDADALGTALVNLGVHQSVARNLPWRFYLAVLDGEPVACSALLLAAGVAGVHFVGTMPEARRQGIGSAVTLAPLREARALGYRIGVLKASNMGVSVYRRLGFQEYHKFGIYEWWGDTLDSR